MIYQGGLYVAVGDNGSVRTSADAVNWIDQTSGSTNTIFGIGYGEGRFLVVGDLGTILSSTNESIGFPMCPAPMLRSPPLPTAKAIM